MCNGIHPRSSYLLTTDGLAAISFCICVTLPVTAASRTYVFLQYKFMRCCMERLFEQFKVYLLTEKRVSTNMLEAYSADLRQLLNFLAEKALFPEEIQQSHLKEFLYVWRIAFYLFSST